MGGTANKVKEFSTDNTQDCYSVSVIYEREIISERSQYLNIPVCSKLCSTMRIFQYSVRIEEIIITDNR